MGRYSTVQAYADSNPKVAAIPYEQATGGAKGEGAHARVPKVNNVSGSAVGAGSGEFHTYRKLKRMEAERMVNVHESHADMLKQQDFQERVERHRTEADWKTAKNTAKRKKQKLRELAKRRKLSSGDGRSASRGPGGDEAADDDDSHDDDSHDDDDDEDGSDEQAELHGEPAGTASGSRDGSAGGEHALGSGAASSIEGVTLAPPAAADLPSDGSFLARFLTANKGASGTSASAAGSKPP